MGLEEVDIDQECVEYCQGKVQVTIEIIIQVVVKILIVFICQCPILRIS